MTNDAGSLLLAAILIVAGFGWGQWWAEKRVRAEQAALHSNRITVSMSANEKDASKMLGLLKGLMEQVEAEKEGIQ